MAEPGVPPDRRYTAERRIRTKKAYDQVFKEGRRIRRPSLVVYCLQRTEGESRLGLAVSRKVGKANIRNIVRRRLKEIFRLNRHQLLGIWDFVVVAQPQAAALSYQLLAEEFLGAACKAGAISGPGD